MIDLGRLDKAIAEWSHSYESLEPALDAARAYRDLLANGDSVMPEFQVDTADTDWVNIYMAGDIDTAKRFIAQWLYEHPQCVTVTPTTYLYHGGVEEGFVVGLINYPRFPSEPGKLWEFGADLAEALLVECGQHSYTQTAPSGSAHVTRRKPTPNEAKL